MNNQRTINQWELKQPGIHPIFYIPISVLPFSFLIIISEYSLFERHIDPTSLQK
jgi:hypothetical protein